MTIHPAASVRFACAAVLTTATAVIVALAIAAPVVADAPVPPTPDEAAGIQPVAFATADERPLAAAPLTGGPKTERGTPTSRSQFRPLGDWTVLLAVAAAFALVAAFRVTSLRRTKSLPPEVFELLGEASLGGQQTARIVRFGPRTLLIGVSSAGCQTLAELDDPQATERIVTACRSEAASLRSPPRSPRVQPPAKPSGGEAR